MHAGAALFFSYFNLDSMNKRLFRHGQNIADRQVVAGKTSHARLVVTLVVDTDSVVDNFYARGRGQKKWALSSKLFAI